VDTKQYGEARLKFTNQKEKTRLYVRRDVQKNLKSVSHMNKELEHVICVVLMFRNW
jgi:hypothetical protein